MGGSSDQEVFKHPLLFLYDEALVARSEFIYFFTEKIFIFPYSIVIAFFFVELIFCFRVAFDSPWGKPQKLSSGYWAQFKWGYFYFCFILELFVFSLCFFWGFPALLKLNHCFLFLWLAALLYVWGYFDENFNLWRLRWDFLFFPFRFLGPILWFLPPLLFVLLLAVGLRLFFLGSFFLFSVLGLFFRSVDFFISRVVGGLWPPFVDVDLGEFFVLFDSFAVVGEGSAPSCTTEEFLEDFGGDPCVFNSQPLVSDFSLDNSLGRSVGLMGGLSKDSRPVRDLELGESPLGGYAAYSDFQHKSFFLELPYEGYNHLGDSFADQLPNNFWPNLIDFKSTTSHQHTYSLGSLAEDGSGLPCYWVELDGRAMPPLFVGHFPSSNPSLPFALYTYAQVFSYRSSQPHVSGGAFDWSFWLKIAQPSFYLDSTAEPLTSPSLLRYSFLYEHSQGPYLECPGAYKYHSFFFAHSLYDLTLPSSL